MFQRFLRELRPGSAASKSSTRMPLQYAEKVNARVAEKFGTDLLKQ
jgi:hypothetical protein